MAESTVRNERKVRRGYVTSDKMDKTVVVEIEDRVKHALYGRLCARARRSRFTTSTTSAPLATSS